MCFLYAVAVLSLLSLSAASPSQCEDLIRPLVLEDLSPISGKWIVIEAHVDSRRFDTLLKTVNSSWAEIVPSHQNDTGLFNQGNMMHGTCAYSSTNLTISNSTVKFVSVNGTGNSTATFLQSCPDCLLMHGTTFLQGVTIRTLHLFGRTGTLSNFDQDMYKRQVECLGLPKPSFIYDGEKVCGWAPQSGIETSSCRLQLCLAAPYTGFSRQGYLVSFRTRDPPRALS